MLWVGPFQPVFTEHLCLRKPSSCHSELKIDIFMLRFGHESFAVRRSWDACAACDFAFPAWGKVGPVMGLRPLRGPPCIPPGAPPKKAFNFLGGGEGTRLVLRELPSLAALAQVISLRDA